MIGHDQLGRNGRLGNQMFQYASLRGIAEANGYDWCIPRPGPLELRDELIDHQLFDAFDLGAARNIGVINKKYLKEKDFTFDPDLLLKCPDNVSLSGYFQSEKYFSHIEKQIIEDFSFVDRILIPCQQTLQFGEAISLHIRRSDYVEKQSYHPLCTLDYYQKSLGKLPQNIPVLIFSDDPSWCKNQDLFQADRFIVSETDDNLMDLCLMTMCSYHIIANSSFSWWGAWLANSKQVVAPKTWFGPAANINDKDLVPETWDRI